VFCPTCEEDRDFRLREEVVYDTFEVDDGVIRYEGPDAVSSSLECTECYSEFDFTTTIVGGVNVNTGKTLMKIYEELPQKAGNMKYKVWIEIEEYDEERDHYEDYDLPESIAVFDTPEEAVAFVKEIVHVFEHTAPA